MLATTDVSAWDVTIIVAYLIGILVLGVLVSHKKGITSAEYFLAGRSLRWPMVGAALFATNISTIHLVGLAEAGFKEGLVIGNFEWMASFCLVLLGLVFAPFYFRNRISTLPEYLEKRYSPGSRTILAFIGVIGALLIHIGISLYAGAAVFEHFFGVDVMWSILIISGVTAIYTVLGGLKAVVVTESIQTVVLLVGAILVTMLAILALPEHGIDTLAQFKERVKPDQLSMLQPIRGADGKLAEFSWLSVLLGYPILGVWYWCSDQTIVQRVLGAKTLRDAQNGPIFAGFLKILPVFIMVLPGVVAYVLFQDRIGDAKDTLPVLIDELVPVGVKGLIAAGLLAALMSTIAGALNSSGTLIAVDIVKRMRPATTDRMQVTVGRISAVVVMLVALAWSTQGHRFGSIFVALNMIPVMFAPAITCVFVWGVFWPRGTKQAALVTLTVGFLIGAINFVFDVPLIGDTRFTTTTLGIPFMQQAWWFFCLCSAIYVVTSLLTPKHTPEELADLCWETPLRSLAGGKLGGLADPRTGAGLLLIVMGILYFFLR